MNQHPDPLPWVHVSGVRTSDPHALDAPIGGYTFSPREGYSDYPDRFISTRKYPSPSPAPDSPSASGTPAEVDGQSSGPKPISGGSAGGAS